MKMSDQFADQFKCAGPVKSPAQTQKLNHASLHNEACSFMRLKTSAPFVVAHDDADISYHIISYRQYETDQFNAIAETPRQTRFREIVYTQRRFAAMRDRLRISVFFSKCYCAN